MKLAFFDSSENVVFNGNQVGGVSAPDVSESSLVGYKLIAFDFGYGNDGRFSKKFDNGSRAVVDLDVG